MEDAPNYIQVTLLIIKDPPLVTDLDTCRPLVVANKVNKVSLFNLYLFTKTKVSLSLVTTISKMQTTDSDSVQSGFVCQFHPAVHYLSGICDKTHHYLCKPQPSAIQCQG